MKKEYDLVKNEVSQKPLCVKAKKASHYSTKRGCYLLF